MSVFPLSFQHATSGFSQLTKRVTHEIPWKSSLDEASCPPRQDKCHWPISPVPVKVEDWLRLHNAATRAAQNLEFQFHRKVAFQDIPSSQIWTQNQNFDKNTQKMYFQKFWNDCIRTFCFNIIEMKYFFKAKVLHFKFIFSTFIICNI